MKICAVKPKSPAFKAGLRAGMELLSIGDKPIRDVLDYQFYTYESVLSLKCKGIARPFIVRRAPFEELGLSFETFLMDCMRTCQNRCVFCFIHQMPPGLRASLYVKDDDARLSFLQGNYITLTNLEEADIARICEMKISPLRVSIHAAQPEVRIKMLQNPRAGEGMTLLKRFAAAGIQIEGQIVLCPGLNDGSVLEQTLEELWALRPAVDSVAVVPVGLTRYREHLPKLSPVTPEIAKQTISQTSRYPRFTCSDEMYLLAGMELPEASAYEEYPQLENGVGMLSLFREQFVKPHHCRPVTLATGTAAAPFFTELLSGLPVTVIPVINHFFGLSITVAGLLTGRDLMSQLKGVTPDQKILISKTMLRHGTDVFLDDVTLSELSRHLGVEVVPVENDGEALARQLRE